MNTTAASVTPLPIDSTAPVPTPRESDGPRTPVRLSMLTLVACAVVSAIVTLAGLIAYDRIVIQPSRRVGVVDIAAIYRIKEEEYARAFLKAMTAPPTQVEGAVPAQMARDFAQRLPAALDDLRRECRCLIIERSAVPTLGEGMLDLTPALRGKLGMRP